MSKEPDVCFIFVVENDVLRLPANKGILAAASLVSDAMFNGDFKEQGDVEIVDASPAAFKEFFNPWTKSGANLERYCRVGDEYDGIVLDIKEEC